MSATPAPGVERITGQSRVGDEPPVGLLIIGAGACGLVAGLRALDLGLDCAVLERDARASGSTALSSGFIPAAGSKVQRAAGIDDSAQAFASDIRRKAKGRADAALAAAYAGQSGRAIDWLIADHGLHFEVLDGFLYPGHSVRRMHAVPEKTGRGLMNRLSRAADTAGLDVLLRARALTLLVDADDRVRAVRVLRPDGRLDTIGCERLLLACNGYGGNVERIGRHLPAMRDAVFAGHTGNDGSALAWGEALGAGLADLGGYQGHGSWAVPQGQLITWALMTEGGVQVNTLGQRFHDESAGYSEAAVQVLGQPGSVAFDVFDAPLLALARGFPDFVQACEAGALRQAASVDELATVLGCDRATLQRTLDEIAGCAQSGRPDRFGRRHSRALQPPYFAVRVTGALFHTQGGLDVDEHCRVRRADGSPLPNLYAAGGAARGVSGNEVWGYLSGNGLLSAVAGGYIAASTAAADARSGIRQTTNPPLPNRNRQSP
ncbi:MAG: FAD-binding protein [Burkholderiaceae bacterium]